MNKKVLSLHPKDILTDKKLATKASTILIWDLEPQVVDVIQTKNESFPEACECEWCAPPNVAANPLSEEFRDMLEDHIAAVLRVIYESPKPRESTAVPEGFLAVS